MLNPEDLTPHSPDEGMVKYGDTRCERCGSKNLLSDIYKDPASSITVTTVRCPQCGEARTHHVQKDDLDVK